MRREGAPPPVLGKIHTVGVLIGLLAGEVTYTEGVEEKEDE